MANPKRLKMTTEVLPFSEPDDESDVALIVEDKTIHYPKTLLSISSPVFKAMFDEKPDDTEFTLDGSYDEMIVFLQLIHPKHSTKITDEHLLSLLALSKEYQMDSVKSKCVQYIETETQLGVLRPLGVEPRRHILFMYACDEYGLTTLVEQMKMTACNLTSEKFSTIRADDVDVLWKTPSFTDALILRCEALEQIIADSNFNFKVYCEQYDKWKRCNNKNCKIVDCAKCVLSFLHETYHSKRVEMEALNVF